MVVHTEDQFFPIASPSLAVLIIPTEATYAMMIEPTARTPELKSPNRDASTLAVAATAFGSVPCQSDRTTGPKMCSRSPTLTSGQVLPLGSQGEKSIAMASLCQGF